MPSIWKIRTDWRSFILKFVQIGAPTKFRTFGKMVTFNSERLEYPPIAPPPHWLMMRIGLLLQLNQFRFFTNYI